MFKCLNDICSFVREIRHILSYLYTDIIFNIVILEFLGLKSMLKSTGMFFLIFDVISSGGGVGGFV